MDSGFYNVHRSANDIPKSDFLFLGGEAGDQRQILIKKEVVLFHDTDGAVPTPRYCPE
jgi:hypothetical protein